MSTERQSFRERFTERLATIPERHIGDMRDLLTQIEFVNDVMEAWLPMIVSPADRAVAMGVLNSIARSNPKIQRFYRSV